MLAYLFVYSADIIVEMLRFLICKWKIGSH